jgi:hypothetical protein
MYDNRISEIAILLQEANCNSLWNQEFPYKILGSVEYSFGKASL